jgi:hypothetical protein
MPTFIEFQQAFAKHPVIELQQIRLRWPSFDSRRLFEWQQKGWVEKLRNGLYRLASAYRQYTPHPFELANALYSPSYVSLTAALAYYQLIPEASFHPTSITTRKPLTISTPDTQFYYRHVQPVLFGGYTQLPGTFFRIAHPEKALLDLVWLNARQGQVADYLEGLRINALGWVGAFSPTRWAAFVQAYQPNRHRKIAEADAWVLVWVANADAGKS